MHRLPPHPQHRRPAPARAAVLTLAQDITVIDRIEAAARGRRGPPATPAGRDPAPLRRLARPAALRAQRPMARS